MCFGMDVSGWEGPKQIWSLFVLWREGYKERRLQGRSEIKDITLINRVGYSRRPFLCNHQWMIPWTRKLITWTVTEKVTLDQSCNSVVYNVHLTRIWPFKFDYFSWSVWVNVCPILGAFTNCLFWHLEGVMDMCIKPSGLKQGESSVFLMSCIKYCMGQTELLQMPHEALNHPGTISCFSGIWGTCSCLSWECLSCALGDTGLWFFSASFVLPTAVLLVQISSPILLLWSF